MPAKPLPKNAKILQVSNFTFDGTDQEATVTYDVELSNGANVEYTSTLCPEQDREFALALTHVWDVVRKRAYEPVKIERELLCDTCTSACCYNYHHVQVTERDIDRLCEATKSKDLDGLRRKGIIGGDGSMGGVGWLGKVAIDEETWEEVGDVLKHRHVCMFLAWSKEGLGRCTIYKHRPDTCRGFEEQNCEDYTPADESLVQIRRLNRDARRNPINPNFPKVDMDRLAETTGVEIRPMKGRR